MTNDLDRLRQYAAHNSEEAFAALVRRHLDLVYSAALRQVRSPELAEEVAQSVFADLASNSLKLKPDTILTAWLYQVTRHTAIDVVRREARRQIREQVASEMNAMNATAADWTYIETLLDEAMDALDDTNRAAVLLHYLENKSLREVGRILGTSEDAAQKRVSRAVERLREFFAKRGMAVGAGGLVAVISANAVQAAPVGLAAAISTAAALAGTTLATAPTATATKAIAMTALPKTLVTAVVIASAVIPLVVQHEAQSRLRHQDSALRQQADQLAQLTAENERVFNLLALAKSRRSLPNDQSRELLRLRSQVGSVSREVRDLARLTAAEFASGSNDLASLKQLWSGRVNQLKQWLDENASERIPELQFLNDRHWLEAVYPHQLETVEKYQRAMSTLRANAELRPVEAMHRALRQYSQENGGQFPSDLSQLKPFLDLPMDDTILERYEIVPTSAPIPELRPGGDRAITQKSPVNAALDTRYAFDLTNVRDADETFTHRWIRVR